jgi:hypothetical protein
MTGEDPWLPGCGRSVTGPADASTVFSKTVSTKAGSGGRQVAALTAHRARMPEDFTLSHARRRRIALPPKGDPGSA